MMAVAILTILAGVSFVGVNRYMRSMALLERNGIAKEIFVAAQNHLTMAQGQGYLGVNDDGFGKSDKTADKGFYTVGLKDAITSVMLPFGSIDETVRASGNYYIRYQKETGRVLDVFYWTTSQGRFDLAGMNDGSKLSDALSARGNDTAQKSFSSGGNGVLGWFGGERAVELPSHAPYLAPDIEIHNDDVLYLKVTNPNTEGVLVVYIEGMTSGAVACFNYGGARPGSKSSNSSVLQTGSKPGQRYIVLDDVANGDRLFSKIASFPDIDVEEGAAFIPGEDIRVYAEAYNKEVVAGIGRSASQITNSLFQSVETETVGAAAAPANPAETESTIYIKNFRHLENLNDAKSHMNPLAMGIIAEGGPVKAEQTEDLFWNTPDVEGESGHSEKSYVRHVNKLYSDVFKEDYTSDYTQTGSMVIFGDSSSAKDCYVPVSPNYELAYNGVGNAVWDVTINYASDAGLFGSMTGGSLSNLELINFNVTSGGGNAGALAGTLTANSNSTLKIPITNVIAYNTPRYETSITGNIRTSGDGKSAGGLIGSLNSSATATVTACAASLYVDSAGDAGGLVGTIKGPIELTKSYSGGHTVKTKAAYYDKLTPVNMPNGEQINVIGGRNAGGLVGNADLNAVGNAGKIEQCYSTCSVYTLASQAGLYAGGLVGEQAGGTIALCYAVGYVSGKEETDAGSTATITDGTKICARIGQFAGNLTGVTMNTETPNWYYMIVNERYDTDNGFTYLAPVGGGASPSHSGITALDETVNSYNSFTMSSAWNTATPYDPVLGTYYQNKYNLRTVEQLGTNLTVPNDMKEYIDEFFVKTHHGDWPAPETFVINTAGGGTTTAGG